MNSEATLYINDKDNLVLKIVSNNAKYYIDENIALRLLKKLDLTKCHDFKFMNKDLKFKCSTFKFKIKNFSDLIGTEIVDYFVKTLTHINYLTKKEETKSSILNTLKVFLAVPTIAMLLNNNHGVDLNLNNQDSYNNEQTIDNDELVEPTYKTFTTEEMAHNRNNYESLYNYTSDQVGKDKYRIYSNFNEGEVDINFNYSNDSINTSEYVHNTWGEIVNKYSVKTGLDPRLIEGVICHESHGNIADNNLMQIIYSTVETLEFDQYDFESMKYVHYVFCNSPENYDENTVVFTRDDIHDPEKNIYAGSVLLKYMIEYENNNILAGLQAYNFGSGAFNEVLTTTVSNTSYSSKNQLLNDYDNPEFLNYLYIRPGYGDHYYIPNVFKYVTNLDEPITIEYLDNNQQMGFMSLEIKQNGHTKSK